MELEIKKISSKAELKSFIKFQYRLYKRNSYFVPPLMKGELNDLIPERNPASEFCDFQCWLAYHNGKIAGRIGGIINHKYNEKWQHKKARFSWFDCIENEEVAFSLFRTMEAWASEKGMDTVYGPFGFTNLDRHGILVEGFEELATTSANYNYPYYKDFIEKYGFTKEIDWVERQIIVPDKLPDKIYRLADLIMEKNRLHYGNIQSKAELMHFVGDIFDLYNLSYAQLYGMLELTEKQKQALIKKYMNIINTDYISVIYNEENQMVAFGIAAPSLARAFQKAKGKLYPFGIFHIMKALRKNDTIDLLLIGVHPDYQKKGVNALLFNKVAPYIFKKGFKFVETTQNLETNLDVQNQWRFYENRLHKRSRSYIKKIDIK